MIFPVDFSLVVSLEQSTHSELWLFLSQRLFFAAGASVERGTRGLERGSFPRAQSVHCIDKYALDHGENDMIRKLASGEYRLYSRKINPKTGKRRNLGTFKSRAAAEKHERDVQYFKRH
jgi:hypothetical protein